ncbi:3-phosphoserine/phosphohydroxythreonine transaminase [Loigolactobacillus zhaoyuanensis]|uniref:3-phosphoserine/phosphohydroxythreonine transaminase n=1 Tax=Loigolactobacillus zhaoyuanensis TaxID=2486017 RepID=UPI000F743951|nr:3-phosphoserine/phosphohydroxythreonine transaminase [Loigolactobacillus zhaoyuanensis]
MQQVYNFAAGPAVLPQSVLKQVQAEFLSYHGSGMSITEISHRSSLFQELYHDAEQTLRQLMALPDNYRILFLQGGASLQFYMLPLNLAVKRRVAYVDTGHWSQKAVTEAQKLPGMQVDVVASSKDSGYTTIPSIPTLTKDYDYLHITTNNTIEGTAFNTLPATKSPLIADMSSNILAQNYPFEKFGLIYAGAQKNIGPAGLTVVIVRDDLLGQVAGLPTMLDYTLQAKKDSAYNTPPVFDIYTAGLVFHWLQDLGGIAGIEKINRAKAGILYDFLAQSKLFRSPVAPAARSLTNVPFVTGDPELDAKFIAAADAAGFKNLKGHRLVGGMRASLYNALPIDAVTTLVDFMEKFEKGAGK